MCKILAMAGIPRGNVGKAWKFAQAALKPMTKNDKDGVGYAAMTAKGDLFGERWLHPKDAFRNRARVLESDKVWAGRLGRAVKATDRYSSFGNLEFEDAASIILHARMATCEVSMENTHPFVEGNTALIHNGVISNARELTLRSSTCDSEAILNEYLDSDVSGQPERIQEVADMLRGYYACAVLTMDGMTPVMDVFKDDAARLVATWVDDIGTIVFATNAEILHTAARKCRFHLRSIYDIEPGQLIRLSVETGTTVGITEFEHGLLDWQFYKNSGTGQSGAPTITLTPSTTGDDLPVDDDDIEALIQARLEDESHLKGA